MARNLTTRNIYQEGENVLIVEGSFEGTDININQKFVLKKESKWLDEHITITNLGNKKVRLGYINLGFKKTLFRQYSGWC